MKVFLVEPNYRYDLTAVEAYGKIEYISDKPMNPFNTKDTLDNIVLGLKGFDPTEDYICMTGNMQTVALLMMIAYSLFPTFKVLAFDARISSYKERVISNV